MNLSAVFKQTSRCLPNVLGSFIIIHRVQMYAGNNRRIDVRKLAAFSETIKTFIVKKHLRDQTVDRLARHFL